MKKSKTKNGVAAREERSIHPLSTWLKWWLSTTSTSQSNLAKRLKVDPSQVSRLLAMSESDRPPLKMLAALSTITRDITPSSFTPLSVEPGCAWKDFLATRRDLVHFALLAATVGNPLLRNPYEKILSFADECEWQRIAKSAERWIITDYLAEAANDECLDITCQRIVEGALRLVLIMPERVAESQLKIFIRDTTQHKRVPIEILRANVTVLQIDKDQFAPPFLRIRVDDFVTPSPFTSGVLSVGSFTDPLMVAMTPQTLEETIRWLSPIVRMFLESPNAGERTSQKYRGLTRLTF
jgi:transcriptional regulator with XRE-family HTH domain